MLNILLLSNRFDYFQKVNACVNMQGNREMRLFHNYTQEQGLEKIGNSKVNVLLLDYYFLDIDKQIIQEIKKKKPTLASIVIGSSDDQNRKNAIDSGCDNYIEIDALNPVKLRNTVFDILQQWELEEEFKSIDENTKNQTEAIVHHQRKLLDSIRYAKRIQDTLLSNRMDVYNTFGDFGIVYKAKDIVCGDFYFVTEKGGYQYLAVGDCTGHGVPGAFMTILCNNLLKNAVEKKDKPKEILQHVHDELFQSMRQYEAECLSDGMDIALIRIDKMNEKVVFAGANRPLLIQSKNGLREIRGVKRCIGKTYFMELYKEFDEIEFDYEKDDRLFLYSDGVVDQFGGKDEKKFTSKQLRRLISDTYGSSMKRTSLMINEYLETWMKGQDQTDDMLLLGVSL